MAVLKEKLSNQYYFAVIRKLNKLSTVAHSLWKGIEKVELCRAV